MNASSGPVWIIGCRGMLGAELDGLLARGGVSCTGTDIECDIADPAALEAFAAGKGIRWLVNCAAYTAVDRAEDEEARAQAVNAAGAGNLAVCAARGGARLIHLSTDYVFDGRGARPYLEADPVAPLGAYGRTKAEGERRVLAAGGDAIVLRTAWLYGRYGRNFVNIMLQAMRERPVVRVVADQHGTPTSAATLAGVIAEIIGRGTLPPGIWHLTDGGETTWYGFAREIRDRAAALGLVPAACRVEPITTAQYPTRARRPAYSVLDRHKIESWLGRSLPPWQDSLRAYLEAQERNAAHSGSLAKIQR